MTIKLTQKHLLNGTQELTLGEDCVKVRTKAPFKDAEEITVMLTVINPEPVVTKSTLNFNSRVNGCTLISLYLGKPSTEEFNAFVKQLKQRALEEFNAFAGLRSSHHAAGIEFGVNEEPSNQDQSAEGRITKTEKFIDAARVENAIEMLTAQMDIDEIRPFTTALAALKDDPQNRTLLLQVVNAFNDLGPKQGPVLAYASYVGVLLSGD